MGKIESIKQKILQLDAGSFQNLCDSYLSEIGYTYIMSLGGQAGTRKTTRGTPDTYFTLPNSKYVFVEYTTQITNLDKKIKEDLEKCLDVSKTKIPYDKISEIIYCHTSSNIKPESDQMLKSLCENKGIKLTLVGIDQLAEDIYLSYPILARDFLDIAIDTNQIMTLKNFVKEYNSNRLSAPIDTNFLFREKEITDIDEALTVNNIVILKGAAGTGKTRLALYYADKYQKDNDAILYVVTNKSLSIYEDLKLYIDKPGKYIFVVDDANQLSDLHHLIRYTTKQQEKFDVKIIITVRDYALEHVVNEIREICTYEIVNVDLLKDNQIKELLEKNLGIVNQVYQDKILMIAEGNARIAMLAGKIALDASNDLQAIHDVSQLYVDYYGNFLNDKNVNLNNDLLKTAGLIAFLGYVYLNHSKYIVTILDVADINRDDFIENVKALSEKEILDIYYDKAVKFSDQCLSNYMLKYVFYDKKLLSLSDIVGVYFPINKEKTMFSINTLINVFSDKELSEFVNSEVAKLWDIFEQEKPECFFDFVKSFFPINQIRTLIILKNKIEQIEVVDYIVSDKDLLKVKNFSYERNEITDLLGNFADRKELDTALDLFFEYYRKRPDLGMDFYQTCLTYFDVKKDSRSNEYYTQILFLEKIKEYSNNWYDRNIVILFLEFAKSLIKIDYSPAESGRNNTIVWYNFSLDLSNGVREYRRMLWEYISEIGKRSCYQDKIREIFDAYKPATKKIGLPVMAFDFEYIKNILVEVFPVGNLKNSILVNKLLKTFNDIDRSKDTLLLSYLDCELFKTYKVLLGPDFDEYESYEEKRKENIQQFIKGGNLQIFKNMINVCNECRDLTSQEQWRLTEGLGIALDYISENKNLYIQAIDYYLEKNTPLNVNACLLVKSLFSLITENEVYALINGKDFNQKNYWIYAYYHELPQEVITEYHVCRLYDFLKDESDVNLDIYFGRNIDFLEKYSKVDENVFLNGCKIILAKKCYSHQMAYSYFATFFNPNCNNAYNIVEMFSDDTDLLIEIYVEILLQNKSLDYNGDLLKEIYKVNMNIVEKYISALANAQNIYMEDYARQLQCFFELDEYIDIYNDMVKYYKSVCKFPFHDMPNIIEAIVFFSYDDKNFNKKQDQWIRQYICEYIENVEMLYYMFSVIANFKDERKLEYVQFFLERNADIEVFKQIPLVPISYSWSDSRVPIIDKWIDYLKKLLSLFIGLEWIEHKKHVDELIEFYKKELEKEKIEEFIQRR